MKRLLNLGYAIEVLNGRLNGSAEQVEDKKRTGFNNVTYVKKIGGRGIVSAVCQKYNMQRYMEENNVLRNPKIKVNKKIVFNPDPYKYGIDDIFGFMRADNETITKEQYELLTQDEKDTFKKDGNKGYKRNVTKKRKSRMLMSSLINVSNRKINFEWNVCSTTGDNMPYNMETYSGIFAGISNLNINEVGSYNISDIESEFRDYSVEEKNADDVQLSKEEKYNRIETTLRGLQHLSIEGNQANYLTDTRPKFVIMGEYSWGNNEFQGLIKEKGLDIEALKETLDEDEEYRISNIWIGVSSKMHNENYQGLKNILKEELKDYDYVHIGTIKQAFDGYLDYLKESL
jgi:hypothetical protein